MAKRPLLERLRLKKQTRQPMLTGAVWYSAETWAQIKASATDPDRFEASFDEWVVMAERALREFSACGLVATKVLIEPTEFAAWCGARHAQNDASSRSMFVSEKLRSADRKENA